MHQDNNLNVIKNDKDEQLVKQKVNPISGYGCGIEQSITLCRQ